MRRILIMLFILFFLLIGSGGPADAQILGRCLSLSAIPTFLERYGLEMRQDRSVVHAKTGAVFEPTCQQTGPAPVRECINCSNPEEVQKRIGQCFSFVKGETCALAISLFGLDITWTSSETFACDKSLGLGQEVPGAPLATGHTDFLDVDGVGCVERAASATQSGIGFGELSPTPNARVCGTHITGGTTFTECARGTP